MISKRFLFLIISAAFLFSCKTKIGVIQQPAKTEKAEPVQIIEEDSKTSDFILTGTVLKNNSALYLFGRDEKMHSFFSVSDGTILGSLNSEIKRKENKNPIIEKVLKSDDKEEIYYQVIYNNVDFWIFSENFANNSRPALIIENCPLYSDKELTVPCLEKNILYFGSSVAVMSPDEKSADSKGIEIYFYDKTSSKKITAYADLKNLSTLTDDIEVMKIVEQLKVTKRAYPRNELFLKAEKYKPCKKVAAALKAQQTEYITNNYEDALKALPKARYGVNVPELMTVDQSKDPFK